MDHLPGSRKSGVKVCTVPRALVAGALGLLGAVLLQRAHALLTLAWSLSLGVHQWSFHFLPSSSCCVSDSRRPFKSAHDKASCQPAVDY